KHFYDRRANSPRTSGDDGNAPFQRQNNTFSRHRKYDTEQQATRASGESDASFMSSARSIAGLNLQTPGINVWKSDPAQMCAQGATAPPARNGRVPCLQWPQSLLPPDS